MEIEKMQKRFKQFNYIISCVRKDNGDYSVVVFDDYTKSVKASFKSDLKLVIYELSLSVDGYNELLKISSLLKEVLEDE